MVCCCLCAIKQYATLSHEALVAKNRQSSSGITTTHCSTNAAGAVAGDVGAGPWTSINASSIAAVDMGGACEDVRAGVDIESEDVILDVGAGASAGVEQCEQSEQGGMDENTLVWLRQQFPTIDFSIREESAAVRSD